MEDDEGDDEDDAAFVHRPAHPLPSKSSPIAAPNQSDASDAQVADAPQNARKVPPEVIAAYEAHIPLLHKRAESGMPQLYEQYQTFWVPQKSNFFLLTGSSVSTAVNTAPDDLGGDGTAATPIARSSTTSIQVHNPAFFFWDPLPLVLGGIRCPEPECRKPLKREGYVKGPRKVLIGAGGMAGESCFWICGSRYVPCCSSCQRISTPPDFGSFLEVQVHILRQREDAEAGRGVPELGPAHTGLATYASEVGVPGDHD